MDHIHTNIPSHDIERPLVFVFSQVELEREDLGLLEGHRHPRSILAALAAREAETWRFWFKKTWRIPIGQILLNF